MTYLLLIAVAVLEILESIVRRITGRPWPEEGEEEL